MGVSIIEVMLSEPDSPSTQSKGALRWAPCSADGAIVRRGATLPPPPPGCRYVPVKLLGVVIADDDLRKRIDRVFHAPMIVLALLVLPLLVLDYLYIKEGGPDGPTRGWMWWLVIGGLTLIWIAFTVEFVIKIAIAESRWEYLRRNWLDLIIIIIPVLRPLRVAAVARTSQAFRLRGVGFKLARYIFTLLLGMEASNRIMRRLGIKPGPARKKPEDMTRHELIDEVRRRRKLTDNWEAWYARQQKYLLACDQRLMSNDQPREQVLPADGPQCDDVVLPSSNSAPVGSVAPYNPTVPTR
jgi:hypothetical protein